MSIHDKFKGDSEVRYTIDALLQQPMLQLNKDVAIEFQKQGQLQFYEEGDYLIREGAAGDSIVFILAGETCIEINSKRVARRLAGNHVGEMAMVDVSESRSADVIAARATVALSVGRDDFREIVNKNGNGYMWESMVKELAARLRQRRDFVEPKKQVVLLIHGIRTRAEWQEMVKEELTGEGTKVIPIKYGRFDLFRFWCPVFTRAKALQNVETRVQSALAANLGSEVVVIAHSFGSYAITRVLQKNPLVKFDKLILCGGIICSNFPWKDIKDRAGVIINDCGINDIYPVLAKFSTFGYGNSGRYGFGTSEVQDRFFKIGHSGFLDKEFVKEYWTPFVKSGVVVQGVTDLSKGAGGHSIRGVTRLLLIVATLSVVLLLFLYL